MNGRFKVSQHVRASMTDDGLVLLDLNDGLVLSSNTVGGRIWQLVERQLTCDEIARDISATFGVTFERAIADVTSFIATLSARGLVARVRSC